MKFPLPDRLFLSADWGSSFLRVKLVHTEDLHTLAEEKSGQGIAAVFREWQNQRCDRVSFYLSILREQIVSIEQKANRSLKNVPLLLSGMASSTLGMMELPYAELPFAIDGSGAITCHREADAGFPHPLLLISGVRSQDDVMRGEETQLIGCLSESAEDGIYIFPGTHSKHIRVENGYITGFRTYMTGECFDLLSNQSLLSGSVEKTEAIDTRSFLHGIHDGREGNLLHSLFRVRTNSLFGILSTEENFHYLSGLLIGSELRDLDGEVYLCSSGALKTYYEMALSKRAKIFPGAWVDQAAVRGQYRIFNRWRTAS